MCGTGCAVLGVRYKYRTPSTVHPAELFFELGAPRAKRPLPSPTGDAAHRARGARGPARWWLVAAGRWSCCQAPSIRQDSMAAPGNFGGGSAGPDQGFLGITSNEGAAKCTGARARPEPCAAKAEPPGHKAREARGRRERERLASGCLSATPQ
jgi:hypothetical protein